MKEFQRVDKKAKTKWRVSRFIGLIFLAIALAPAILVCWATDDGGALLILSLICSGVIILLQLLNLIVYPIIEYIQWAYLVDDDRIEIKKGIFWRSHTVIPISRIQHVSAKSGPLQNLFGLATVEIHTAGGVHKIDELSKATADGVCDSLKNVINLKVAEQKAEKLMKEVKAAEVREDA